FCSVMPDRLVGIAAVSCYDVAAGIAEMERCRDLGMRGIIVWQLPPAGLEFHGRHHEPLWAAAAEMGMPVSTHILTGHDWSKQLSDDVLAGRNPTPEEWAARGDYALRAIVNEKVLSAANSLHDLIASGVFQRHPELKLALVENEIGWIPFFLNQWDKW